MRLGWLLLFVLLVAVTLVTSPNVATAGPSNQAEISTVGELGLAGTSTVEHDPLAPDSYFGASEFSTVMGPPGSGTCDRCMAKSCDEGKKCGLKGSGCWCRVCDGSLDCWRGKK